MAFFTAAAAIIGVGSMAYGAYERSEGQERQEEGLRQQQEGARIQAEAARQQAGISKEQAAASVIAAGAERDLNVLGSQQSIAASQGSLEIGRRTVAAQQAIEAQKMNAMELDARRNQLEIIRNQQRSRAIGLATATASGSNKGSGLQGAYGQFSGQTGVNLLGVQQNLEIGRNIFDHNYNISQNNLAMGDLQNMYAVQQANNQTTKANLTYNYAVQNAGFQSRLADTQTLASQGAGQVSAGGGQAALGQSQISSGNAMFSAGPSIFSAGQSLTQAAPSFTNFFNSGS